MLESLVIGEKCPRCGKNTYYYRKDIKEHCCDTCNLRIKDND